MRSRKRLLLAANAALAAAVLASVSVPAILPLAGADATGIADTQPRAVGNQIDRKPESLSAYAAIYQRDLRRPLFDLRPAPEVKPEPKKPQLTLRLMGTAVEPGHTYAFFRITTGQVKMLTVGQAVDGAEVLAIEEGMAKVSFDGQVVTLKVEEEKP